MNPVAMVVSFLVFVICVVLVVMIAKWGLAKLGVATDSGLMNILYLLLVLIMLLLFLSWTGIWHWSGSMGRP